ncbi:MAG: helix-turn-helix transcriptional regulator [Xenococcus sp. (in: cyanobacteria)]
MKQLIDKNEVAGMLGVKPATVYRYRNQKIFLEDVHYIRINSRLIRYYKEVIENWVVCGTSDPDQHWEFIHKYFN